MGGVVPPSAPGMTRLPRPHPGRSAFRRIVAGLSVVAGLALVVFEVRRLHAGGGGEGWFWLAVGTLMVVLGGIDLIAKPAREE